MSHDRGCPCGKEQGEEGYRECSSCVPKVKVRRANLEELKTTRDNARDAYDATRRDVAFFNFATALKAAYDTYVTACDPAYASYVAYSDTYTTIRTIYATVRNAYDEAYDNHDDVVYDAADADARIAYDNALLNKGNNTK